MNDEIMRKVSEALDTEDGIAGDPDVLKAMTESPELAKYVRHLGRLQRWVAAWPLAEPDEDSFEELAQKIDSRLGETFAGDFTKSPEFEEDEEYATVTSALLRAGDGASDSSAALELTMSQITELADQVAEDASAPVPLARVPLKKKDTIHGVSGPAGSARATDDELPAPVVRPQVPRPAAATLMLGTTTDDEVSDPETAVPLVAKAATPPALRPSAADRWKSAPPPAPLAAPDKLEAPKLEAPKLDAPKLEAPKLEAPRLDAPKPDAPKPDAPKLEATKLEATKQQAPKPEAPKPEAPKHEVPLGASSPKVAPSAKVGGDAPKTSAPTQPSAPDKPVTIEKLAAASSKAGPTEDRVSIPMPAPSAPRLDLIEGGASRPARSQPPREEPRSWLPGVLAAAAIGLGVIGVGTLMSRGGNEPRTAGAIATARPTSAPTVPSAAPPPAAPAPAEPAIAEEVGDRAGGGEAMGPWAEAPLATAPAVEPPAPVTALTPITMSPGPAAVAAGAASPRLDDGMAAPVAPATTVEPLAAAAPVARARPSAGASRAAVSTPARAVGARPAPGPAAPGPAARAPAAPPPAPPGPAAPPERERAARTEPPASAETATIEAPGPRGAAGRAGGPGEGSPASTGSATATDPAPRAAAPPPAPPHAPPASRSPVSGTLDRSTVQSVMQGIEPAVRACAGERHGTAPVDVVVQPTGRVTSATITGAFQGSAEGSCIARAVRQARFPEFTGEALRFRFPFAI